MKTPRKVKSTTVSCGQGGEAERVLGGVVEEGPAVERVKPGFDGGEFEERARGPFRGWGLSLSLVSSIAVSVEWADS